MLAPRGPLQHATCATAAQSASKNDHEAGWRHGKDGDALSLPRPTFHWKGVIPPRPGSAKVPLMERPLLLRCKTLINHCPVSAPWWGLNIHLVGSSAPWRSELIISPCVLVQMVSSMVLHIKDYALHGLISHWDHSNVNHIWSSLLSNICIRP